MPNKDPHAAYKPPQGDTIEIGKPIRTLPWWQIRILAASVITAVAAGPIGFWLGNHEPSTTNADRPPKTDEWSIDLLKYPPSPLHVPESIDELREGEAVEVECAWFGYKMYPEEGEKPGFKPTYYQVMTDGSDPMLGTMLALHVEAYGPIPSCEKRKPPLRVLNAGYPDLNPDITSAVPGVVVKDPIPR